MYLRQFGTACNAHVTRGNATFLSEAFVVQFDPVVRGESKKIAPFRRFGCEDLAHMRQLGMAFVG